MKIIVTYTTWKKRILTSVDSVKAYLDKQTVKPDIVYCWLAEEEFPQKEAELPKEFLDFISEYKIVLGWTEKNEYCHKRWHVYDNAKHWEDFVVSIDDDMEYPANHIEAALQVYAKHKMPVIIQDYEPFLTFSYNNDTLRIYNGISRFSNTLRFYGHSIFTPKSFPIDAWTPEMHKLRNTFCPRCDESWLMPFIIKHKTFIVSNDGAILSIKSIDSNLELEPIHDFFGTKLQVQDRFYTFSDVQQYIVLKKVPDLMRYWLEVFPGYTTTVLDSVDISKLVEVICK